MKHTPLKRTAMTKRKTQDQADYDRQFAAMKPAVLVRSGGQCEAWPRILEQAGLPDPRVELAIDSWLKCRHQFRATHVHHRKYRKRGGTNGLTNLVHLCEPCHTWVHAHGGFGGHANVLGLALSAGESEE